MNDDIEFYKLLCEIDVEETLLPEGTILKLRIANPIRQVAVLDSLTGLTISIPFAAKPMLRKIRSNSKDIPVLIEKFKAHFEERRKNYFDSAVSGGEQTP